MILKNKIKSKEDKTIKYIYELDNKQIIEFSYIDNGTGKDIICVPCQTMCNMSCAFCHLTDHVGKIPLRNLTGALIFDIVMLICDDLSLSEDRQLLISYMGCGEPLDNIEGILSSIRYLKAERTNIRFGLATMLPKKRWREFFELTQSIEDTKINLKVHLSLHFVEDNLRTNWMPSAWNIDNSIGALKIYNTITGNPIEVHYTIMDGVNDSDGDIQRLGEIIPIGCTIKFMMYSERKAIDAQKASIDKINKHIEYLSGLGHTVEYYEPPGNDIGSSCGQFLTQLTEEYEKGNIV
jgi:23S rRNA (adenine2503-C2)-methyltransferase